MTKVTLLHIQITTDENICPMNLMLWLYLYSCCVVDDAETVEEDYENDSNGKVEIEAPSNNQNSTYRTNIDQGNML